MKLGGTIHLNKPGIYVILVLLVILFVYSISNGTSNENKKSLPIRKINLGILLEVAVKTAENGGYKVVEATNNLIIKSKGLTKEGLVDRVTSADLSSHCAMTETMKYFFPFVNIISEEANTRCKDDPFLNLELKKSSQHFPVEFVEEEDVTVWIDPLDATYEFSEKMYSYVTTMVCIAVKGKPIIGVIHRPFNSSTSWAWVDRARSVDLNQVLKKNISKDFLNVIISLSHKGEIEKVLKSNFHDNIHIITAPGAGYKALEVATGKVDAYLHITAIKKWDICAGNAIISALGGEMTTKSGKLINYLGDKMKNDDGVIASITHHDLFVHKLQVLG